MRYFIFILVGVVILAAGIGYRTFLMPAKTPPASGTGTADNVREVTVMIKKDSWAFEPDSINVQQGEKIAVTIVNEDEYDHGLAIDAFGVQQRIPAHQTVKIEFTATQAGDFQFYCFIPCGEGVVDGHKRTHFDMVGMLHVKGM